MERSKRPPKSMSEAIQEKFSYDGGPVKRRRHQLAPRRPYATQHALSNHGRDPSTACGIELIATKDCDTVAPAKVSASKPFAGADCPTTPTSFIRELAALM